MAGHTFSIGAFTFLALEGVPGSYAKQLELLVLPFVDGESTRELGKHAEPFVLRSVVDTVSEAGAIELFNSYLSYIGGATRELVYRSANFTNAFVVPTYVDVLKVSRGPTVPAQKMVGGLTVAAGGNGVVLRADWTLRMVPA